MKSILHELYNGHIYPAEQIVLQDSDYRPLNRKIREEKESLKRKLSEEDIKRLSQLEDMYTHSITMEETETFIYGFKLASLLMIEIFTGEGEVYRG